MWNRSPIAMRFRFAAGSMLPGLLLHLVAFYAVIRAEPPDVPDASRSPETPAKVDFQRDVLPILESRCFACHGEDEQEGQLRLDARAIVMRGGTSGPAVVKGNAEASPLYQRIIEGGDQERMPLGEEPLSEQQTDLIRRWIDQGAAWPDRVGSQETELQRHWAYQPPRRPELAHVEPGDWGTNAIDAFVLRRMRDQGLSPSPPAEPARLLRRVYLDLIGLPPSVEEVRAFVSDRSPDAFEKVVDRLLSSPRYGEHWARQWLDLARYADSNGYQADQYRDVWPYRDWVIQAMNRGMPFDRFTIEQLAGDLLPEATLSQKIATGFHRLTTCNVEAGVDPEENRVEQIIDRVNATGTVWLGTTLECAQCHNHKYDPFSQRDYYRLFAYFNNTPLEVEGDGVTYNFTGPKMALPLPEDEKAKKEQLTGQLAAANAELQKRTEAALAGQADWELSLVQQPAASETEGASEREGASETEGAEQDRRKTEQADVPDEIRRLAELPAGQRKAADSRKLREFFLSSRPEVAAARKRRDTLQRQLKAIEPTTTLVMVEMEQPRQTSVFGRGDFLNPIERVEPGTPRALHAADASLPANRLGLARWLVDPANPLVARVTVNRWWAAIFGAGLVTTVEDFGAQGERPTHPDLLDWLAREFMDHGWSMKHVHKQIVMSSTYRQSSRVLEEQLRLDPYNRWLARGPRFRMPAEMIRDQALAASGLLQEKMGGPPVFPPQPEGIWRHVGRNAPKYDTSQGTDRFRRGIYVIWRRSAPYPSFVNFDAPDRASCVVKRPRTNTPLQALTLLNDPAYFEMARGLARRIVTDSPAADIESRVEYGLRRCVAREPRPEEVRHLAEVYRREAERLAGDERAATTLLNGQPLPDGVTAGELAAWIYVSNLLLNLDETITKG